MENQVQEVQLELFKIEPNKSKVDLSTTFANNMKLPIHKWYRYTAGFSAVWVRELIEKENGQNVLDPFGGSGTVMIEGEFAGINSIGIEAHPYIYRIANAKLSWQIDINDFKPFYSYIVIPIDDKPSNKVGKRETSFSVAIDYKCLLLVDGH